MMARIIGLLIGYAFGLIQTAYIIGIIHHTDIRTHGSGNAGTTNALRTFGKKAGIITLLVDCLKCMAAMFVVKAVFAASCPDILPLLSMYAAAGCILGHNFPFYMGFKGGKGVACSLGLCLSCGPIVSLCLVLFVLVFFKTHYVSLASLSAYTSGVAIILVLANMGYYGMPSGARIEMSVIALLLLALSYYKHKENIKRLKAGTENKVFLKKS